MLKQKTKTQELDGKNYRFTKLDARSASYLAMKVASIVAPVLSKGIGVSAGELGASIQHLDRIDFDEIQTMLLRTICSLSVVEGQEIPTPIIKSNGDFVNEELLYDAKLVIQLTVEAMMFNIGDFFTEAGLTPAVKK